MNITTLRYWLCINKILKKKTQIKQTVQSYIKNKQIYRSVRVYLTHRRPIDLITHLLKRTKHRVDLFSKIYEYSLTKGATSLVLLRFARVG